jgi:SAM-dependent methyltransferase
MKWPGTFHWTPELVRCNLCGQYDAATLFSQDQHGFGLRTVMCTHCGLIYLNPRPTAEDYQEFYRDWYHRLYPARAAFHAGQLGGRIAAETARLRCEAYSSLLGERTRLLEIGPGEGAFLAAIQEKLPRSLVRGVDLSPAEVEACRSKGLDVIQGTIENLPATYGGNTHAALFHVLEHSLNPLQLLRKAAQCIHPGGYLLVEVPNVLGEWQGLGMLHVAHPYLFAPATLGRMLQAAGFQIVQLDSLEGPFFQSSLRAVAKRSAEPDRFPLPSMPNVEVVTGLFAEKLAGWRGELMTSRIKRQGSQWLGTRWTAALWERTTGREWARWLNQGSAPPYPPTDH